MRRSLSVLCTAAVAVAVAAAVLAAAGRFSDVQTSHPRYADIEYAASQGWFVGYDDGTFRPDSVIPEHQIATVVARVFPDGATRADMATFLRGGEERLAAFLNIPWFCSPDARAGDIRAVQEGLGVTADGVWGRGTQTAWEDQCATYIDPATTTTVAPTLSDTAIKQVLIRESINAYSGSCPCPYSTDRAGRRCGGRSAHSRPGGESPLCDESDISQQMIDNYRQRAG